MCVFVVLFIGVFSLQVRLACVKLWHKQFICANAIVIRRIDNARCTRNIYTWWICNTWPARHRSVISFNVIKWQGFEKPPFESGVCKFSVNWQPQKKKESSHMETCPIFQQFVEIVLFLFCFSYLLLSTVFSLKCLLKCLVQLYKTIYYWQRNSKHNLVTCSILMYCSLVLHKTNKQI